MHVARESAPLRVLALYPHPRHIGHVVLGDDGLVAGAAFTCRTKRFPTLELRAASLERLVASSVKQYAPTVVVVVRARGCGWLDAMMAHAITVVDATGLPVRVRYEAALTSLLVEEGVEEYDKLGQSVTRTFFPELARGISSWRRGEEARRRQPRSRWKAAAGALAVMAEMRPRAVRRLARGPLPTGLAELLDRAERQQSL